MELPVALRALKHYNFRLYFSGQAISLIGTWMQRMAVGWLVYSLTHSALMLGIVVFAGQIPMMLLGPYAGAFTDRHSRYKILLATQIASMVQAGLLAGMVLLGYHNITGIIILSALLGVINAFDTPSRQSLMIHLVGERQDLPNAIALNSSMVTLARLLGPAAAGILMSSFGEGVCFAVNFLSFVAVISSLLLMRLKPVKTQKAQESIWVGLRQGYRYMQQEQGIRSAILMMAAISFVLMPYSTLLPVFAKDVFLGDVSTFSWLNSISGLGALLGAVYMASLRPGRNLLRLIVYATSLFAVSLLLFSYTSSFPLALCFILTGEFGMLSHIAATNTYIQTNVDERMRGRVLSYYVMAFQGMQPLGSFLVGYLAHRFGAPLTVLLQGVVGIGTIALFVPSFRKARAASQAETAAVPEESLV